MKAQAAAALATGFAVLFATQYLAYDGRGGLWWLAGVGLTAACIVIAVVLLRMDARQAARKTSQ